MTMRTIFVSPWAALVSAGARSSPAGGEGCRAPEHQPQLALDDLGRALVDGAGDSAQDRPGHVLRERVAEGATQGEPRRQRGGEIPRWLEIEAGAVHVDPEEGVGQRVEEPALLGLALPQR
jgi:hypothetical protein